ncbi:DUF1800 domain-containing protein [Nocardia yunnanensis]|uniref:DUF1800 domain-containing protein n=1 Tax=Nocardia yunnanensis TaxID=2382165 RepID=A0A386ZKV9_9NOCA|nr:DUF1800 domain-containing protein [Nocardia yunnanensis]AYF78058.1 DUF1800 domain-containing protein [Nocardia yunnanensis]
MGMPVEWMHTARVLRRTGFGATGAEIDAVPDAAAYLRSALAAGPDADPALPDFAPLTAPGKGASAPARKAYQAQINGQLDTLTAWWLRRMVAVRVPVREKLTLMWHNHFATSAAKVRSAGEMAAQNRTLRTLGTGDFGALAYAMLTDPAMLRWLDGVTSTVKAPNENLSREFMELFALGHGNGYTETDVREGARALTGWTIVNGVATFDQKRHDGGSKTFLGVTGPLDARGFCTAVLARPESARFVAARLWQQLASDDPPSAAVLDRLTAAYGPGRDLSALVTAICTDPEFVSAPGTVVHGPVEWLVGAVRALRVPLTDDSQVRGLAATLRTLGQLPFYPPNVGGWPRGQGWMSSAAAQLRLTTAAKLVRTADLSALTAVGRADRVDAAGHLFGVGHWSDRSAQVLSAVADQPDRLATLAINTPEYLTS